MRVAAEKIDRGRPALAAEVGRQFAPARRRDKLIGT